MSFPMFIGRLIVLQKLGRWSDSEVKHPWFTLLEEEEEVKEERSKRNVIVFKDDCDFA